MTFTRKVPFANAIYFHHHHCQPALNETRSKVIHRIPSVHNYCRKAQTYVTLFHSLKVSGSNLFGHVYNKLPTNMASYRRRVECSTILGITSYQLTWGPTEEEWNVQQYWAALKCDLGLSKFAIIGSFHKDSQTIIIKQKFWKKPQKMKLVLSTKCRAKSQHNHLANPLTV
jgi:hypothetical protein